MLEDNYAEVDIRAIATDIDTPADVLKQLSEDFNPEIRALVASHPNTPCDVLLKLTARLYRHGGGIPADTIWEFIKQSQQYIRRCIGILGNS